MARFLGSKAKLSRSLGVNVFGLPKIDNIIAKRAGKNKFFKKRSEYGMQLREKQIARHTFGLSEKQFKMYYKKAVKSANITGEELIRQIELRVDNIIYRAGLAVSRTQARQMISHGNFLLNGRKITIPSIQVKKGDVLSLRDKLKKSSLFENLDIKPMFKWLKGDNKGKSVEIVEIPNADEMEQSIKTHLIIEYYSR
ncbi:30S ribosomal protein S4 [Candidatus Gracilibacteria bacterium]|nr:30S ribosomal protein S4 [Candidatus Gracilibacteria bacterium]